MTPIPSDPLKRPPAELTLGDGRKVKLKIPGVDPVPEPGSAPLCPSCGQPASQSLAGAEHDWECRNEACPEFGQAVRADEPPPREPPAPS